MNKYLACKVSLIKVKARHILDKNIRFVTQLWWP